MSPSAGDSSWRGVLRRVKTYWYGSESPHALCVFRILLGVYFLIGWLSILPRIELDYSSEGMAFPYLLAPDEAAPELSAWVARLTQPPAPAVAWLLYAFTLLLIVLITVGWQTRPALLLFLAMYVYYWLMQIHSLQSSFDRLIFMITSFLAMGQCEAVYSLDAWLRRRRGMAAVDSIPFWPARLIAAQIAFMYVGTGIYKVMTPDWSGGNMLYYSLQGSWATPFAFWILQLNLDRGFYDAAVLLTILMEVWAPFMLFSPVWQKVFFAWGFCFHLGISLTLDIWPFMIVPLTYVLFLEPNAFRKFCNDLGRRLRQPQAALTNGVAGHAAS